MNLPDPLKFVVLVIKSIKCHHKGTIFHSKDGGLNED